MMPFLKEKQTNRKTNLSLDLETLTCHDSMWFLIYIQVFCNSRNHTEETYFTPFWQQIPYFNVTFIEYSNIKWK